MKRITSGWKILWSQVLCAAVLISLVSGVRGEGTRSALEKKLAEMVFPEVEFAEATLAEVIEFCARRSREMYAKGGGVNIIATPSSPDSDRPDAAVITLSLRDIPLGDLLRYVGRLSGREVCVEAHSVVFRQYGSHVLYNRSYPIEEAKMDEVLERYGESREVEENDPFSGGGDPARDAGAWLRAAGVLFPDGSSAYYERFSGQLVVRHTLHGLEHVDALVKSVNGDGLKPSSGRLVLREKLADTVIPQLEFVDASLDEGIEFLRMRSGETPQNEPMNLVVIPRPGEPDGRLLTMTLNDIPLGDALGYVAEFAGYHVRVDPHAVVLAPAWGRDRFDFELASFPIYHSGLREQLGESPSAAREWLAKLGVALPNGAGAYFEPLGNRLVVRSYSASVAQLEEVLSKIGEEAATVEVELPEPGVQIESPLLDEATRLAAREVVVDFFSAKTHKERLKSVREPERVGPLMEAWYQKYPLEVKSDKDGEVPVEVLHSKVIENMGRNFVILALDFGVSGKKVVAIEATEVGLKLDWETAVGYQQMPIEEFKKKRPTEALPFRVKLKSVAYVNDFEAEKNRFLELELSYPGQPDFKLFTVIDRQKEWTAPLFELFDLGKAPSVIAKLKYAEGRKDSLEVQIESIVAYTWWPE